MNLVPGVIYYRHKVILRALLFRVWMETQPNAELRYELF